MSLQEQYPDIGWHSLLERLERVDSALRSLAVPMYGGITSIERNNGMLKVVFAELSEDHFLYDIQDAITYRFERISARTCEICGIFGRRRTDLQTVRTLCTEHYALRYSEEHPAPSLMAHPEPHTDY